MPRILVVGSINMDIVAACDRAVRPGETMSVDAIRLVPGGKGANAAVAAARLGGTVRMVGAVGTDAFAAALVAGLSADGIDTRWVARREGPSGAAMIVVDRSTGQNAILVGPGANAGVALPDDDDPFAWADAVVMPLEIPLPLALETARRAKKAGKLVILDPAPARTDLPDELFALCDVVSPNESELALLTDAPGLDRLGPSAYAGGVAEEVAAAAERLRARGVKTVVVKLGSHGAFWSDGGGRKLFVRSRKIEAVDTTAAGDAFTGSLAVSMAEGLAPGVALARAGAAGTLACLRAGAQPSLPTLAEVRRSLE